jgi:hypothetical protein
MTSILAPTENATGNSPREGSGGDVHSEKRDMLLRRCASLALKARVEAVDNALAVLRRPVAA